MQLHEATPTQLRLHQERKERQRRIELAARRVRQASCETLRPRPVTRTAHPTIRYLVPIGPPTHDEWMAGRRKAARLFPVRVVEAEVCAHYGCTMRALAAPTRTQPIVRWRQVSMYLTQKFTSLSLPAIGRRYGDRDHSTVIAAIHRVEKLIAENPAFADDMAALRAKIGRWV